MSTLAGIDLLLHDALSGAVLPSMRPFSGQLILGSGTFNLGEWMIDHEILNIHHVRDLLVYVPIYDWLFLLIGGAGFIGPGWGLMRETDAGVIR